MRKALVLLVVVWLGATGAATAQNDQNQDPRGQARINRDTPQSNNNGQRQPAPPTPSTMPIPRCADLAVTSLGFASSNPGGAPLTGDEVLLQYDVHNAGTSMYVAPSGASQSLALEYSTPGGVHQVATIPLPQAASGTTAAAAQGVTLAQGQSWRGTMRMNLPQTARRWPLRLRLVFGQSSSPYAPRISDCNPDNDQVIVPRPVAATPPPETN